MRDAERRRDVKDDADDGSDLEQEAKVSVGGEAADSELRG